MERVTVYFEASARRGRSLVRVRRIRVDKIFVYAGIRRSRLRRFLKARAPFQGQMECPEFPAPSTEGIARGPPLRTSRYVLSRRRTASKPYSRSHLGDPFVTHFLGAGAVKAGRNCHEVSPRRMHEAVIAGGPGRSPRTLLFRGDFLLCPFSVCGRCG